MKMSAIGEFVIQFLEPLRMYSLVPASYRDLMLEEHCGSTFQQ